MALVRMTTDHLFPDRMPGQNCYSKGCRCHDCRLAKRVYERERKRRLARPDGPGLTYHYVPVAEARAHLRWLYEQGVSTTIIHLMSGVSRANLQRITSGQSQLIRKEYRNAILALNMISIKNYVRTHQPKTRCRLVKELV